MADLSIDVLVAGNRTSGVRGGPYHRGFYTVSAHVPMGANAGATPDGRKYGQLTGI